ncbi:MAG: hypothetical protein KKG33_10740 [candidate division Zixibacteria bacterium]|nr:hypothetical protein [candidate division Zixibacteria bacterium]
MAISAYSAWAGILSCTIHVAVRKGFLTAVGYVAGYRFSGFSLAVTSFRVFQHALSSV